MAIPGATSASYQIVNAQTNDAGSYSVVVSNLYGSAISSNATLTVLARVDYFTELFAASDNDLAFSTLTFTPDGSASFYAPCREVAKSFPTDPAGGTMLPLNDDNFVQITLTGMSTVGIYNRRTNVVFIGSNGYLTMDRGDDEYGGALSHHFDRPRVSALLDDLLPAAGGTVSWKQLSDRVAVTYQNVPHYVFGGTNSFQIEMFFDGRIRLTYLALSARGGLAGLSAGKGVPAGFLESDLSSYGVCVVAPLSISDATVTEGNAGITNAIFNVSLSTNHAEVVSVDFTTTDGTATPGNDYLSVSGTLIFNPGETNQTITVPVLGDLFDEADETFFVLLSNPTNISLIKTQAVGTILDDDTALTITQQPTNQMVRPGSNVTFRVSAASTFPPITYQWRFNGAPLSGATLPSLTVTNVQLANDGVYDVLVTDDVGTIASNPARLAVLIAPFIVTRPVSQTVVEGSDFTMSVEVTGNPVPFAYSWRRGATIIATNSGNYRSNFITLNTTAAGLTLASNMSSSNYAMRLVVYNAANSSPGVLVTFTNTVLADFDRDGIPDAFEQSVGLDPNKAADAARDLDGDGMSNLAEYLAGTDPTNCLSYLKINSIAVGGGATLTFGAVSNRTYTIEYTDALGISLWLGLMNVVARPTDRVETVVDFGFTTNRFYRVVTPYRP